MRRSPGETAAVEPGDCSTSGRRSAARPEELGRSRAGWASRPRASGLQKVVVRATMPDEAGVVRDTVLRIAVGPGRRMALQFCAPSAEPIRPLTDYAQKVVRMRQRGLTYPYELIRMLTPPGDAGAGGPSAGRVRRARPRRRTAALVPVDRPYGQNTANVVVGLINNRHREVPRGHDARHHPRRPQPGGGVAGRARVPAHPRRPRPGRDACASRSSGSRSRPARRSRWRAAPRTWTGSRGCCGG